MSHEGRLSPVELLRQLTLSLERLAAQGLASGAVRGALEELQGGMPRWATFSAELAERLNRWLELQDRIAEGKEMDLHAPGTRMRSAAAGAVEGALEQLHDSMPRLAPVAAELASQMGRGFVEGLGSKTEERAEVFDALLERAGRSFVRAVVDQLDTELKARRGAADGDMRRAAAEVAERVAAASVRGASEELARQLRPLRRPLVVAAGTSSALLLVALLVTRGR